MSIRTADDIDNVYLSSLENKLNKLKERGKDSNKNQRKNFLEDLAHIRDQHLSEYSPPEQRVGFEDDFLNNVPIQKHWLQRKIAPETVATNRQELVKLTESDVLARAVVDKSNKEEEGQLSVNLIMDNSWRLTEFKSIPFCNTYSLHSLDNDAHLIVMDINGIIHCLNQHRTIDLRKFLSPEERNLEEFSLELINTTTFVPEHSRDLFYLATWYSGYDWRVYTIDFQPESHGISPVDSIGDVFPSLEIGQLPGSVIRSDYWLVDKYRFSVIGYDTGYVVATVCVLQIGTVIDRKTIKFSGPISVLKLINHNEESLSTYVLVSSTLGPTAIWTLKMQYETLSWEMVTLLLNSEIYDAILTCAISHDYIFIGSYGEQVLVYSMTDAINPEFCEVFPVLALNVASPIIAIEFLEDNHVSVDDTTGDVELPVSRQLVILSYKGIHMFSVSMVPIFEPLLTPTSPIHGTLPLSGSLSSPVPSVRASGLSSGPASPAVLQIEPPFGSEPHNSSGSLRGTLSSPTATTWTASPSFADPKSTIENAIISSKYSQQFHLSSGGMLLQQHSASSVPTSSTIHLQQQPKLKQRVARLTHPLHTSHQHALQRQANDIDLKTAMNSDEMKSKTFFQK